MWDINVLHYLLQTLKGDINLCLTANHLWAEHTVLSHLTQGSPTFSVENAKSVLQTSAMIMFFYPL